MVRINAAYESINPSAKRIRAGILLFRTHSVITPKRKPTASVRVTNRFCLKASGEPLMTETISESAAAFKKIPITISKVFTILTPSPVIFYTVGFRYVTLTDLTFKAEYIIIP